MRVEEKHRKRQNTENRNKEKSSGISYKKWKSYMN